MSTILVFFVFHFVNEMSTYIKKKKKMFFKRKMCIKGFLCVNDAWKGIFVCVSNVSILHFFKVKDTGQAGVSSSEEATTSMRNGSSESISSICVESDCRSEVEGVQILQYCEMSD